MRVPEVAERPEEQDEAEPANGRAAEIEGDLPTDVAAGPLVLDIQCPAHRSAERLSVPRSYLSESAPTFRGELACGASRPELLSVELQLASDGDVTANAIARAPEKQTKEKGSDYSCWWIVPGAVALGWWWDSIWSWMKGLFQ
jgi:hypothetical protein